MSLWPLQRIERKFRNAEQHPTALSSSIIARSSDNGASSVPSACAQMSQPNQRIASLFSPSAPVYSKRLICLMNIADLRLPTCGAVYPVPHPRLRLWLTRQVRQQNGAKFFCLQSSHRGSLLP
jgi:hypothetical protein